MTARTIAVISAGLGQPSSTRLLADQLAAATADALRLQGDEVEVTVVELRDHAHRLADNFVTGFAAGELKSAIDAVLRADGLIAVTPTFNASYSGLFKMFFDVLDAGSLRGKPVLMGATGGTPRHSLMLDHAMRPLLAFMGAIATPTGVYAATDDFGAGGAHALGDRVARAAEELAAMVGDRAQTRAVDPYADVTPFEDLLAG